MYKYRRVIISVIALLLAAAILTGLLVTVFAANSADIRTEISGLESKQDELDQKKQELEAQIAANNTQRRRSLSTRRRLSLPARRRRSRPSAPIPTSCCRSLSPMQTCCARQTRPMRPCSRI